MTMKTVVQQRLMRLKIIPLVSGTPTVSADSVSKWGRLVLQTFVTARAEETNFLFTVDLSQGNDSFVALHSFSESDLSMVKL